MDGSSCAGGRPAVCNAGATFQDGSGNPKLVTHEAAGMQCTVCSRTTLVRLWNVLRACHMVPHLVATMQHHSSMMALLLNCEQYIDKEKLQECNTGNSSNSPFAVPAIECC